MTPEADSWHARAVASLGRPEPWIVLVLGVAVSVTLATAAALTLDAHPNGDDFCLGADARDVGWLACARHAYLVQGGRWAGYFLACALPGTSFRGAYELPLLALLVLTLLCVRFVVGSVLRGRESRRLAWGLAFVATALYWAGIPHPGETFYWLDSAYVYLLGPLAPLVVVACLLRLPPGRRRLAVEVALGCLAALSAALHELFGLVLAGMLVAGAGLAWYRRDARLRAWWIALAFVAASLASVLLAPGNAVRERGSVGVADPSVALALRETARMWLRVLDVPTARGGGVGRHGTPLGWVLDPRLLAASLLFVRSARLRSLGPRWPAGVPRRWRWLVPAVSLGALTGSFLAGGWALGRTLPLRAFDGIYVIFLAGWFATLFVFTEPSRQRQGGDAAARLAAACVLALGLLLSTNVKLGLRDLSRGWTGEFDREMARRYERAEELRGGPGELVARRVDPWPESYYANDVVEDPGFDSNACWGRYFEIDSVRLDGGSPGGGSLDGGRLDGGRPDDGSGAGRQTRRDR